MCQAQVQLCSSMMELLQHSPAQRRLCRRTGNLSGGAEGVYTTGRMVSGAHVVVCCWLGKEH